MCYNAVARTKQHITYVVYDCGVSRVVSCITVTYYRHESGRAKNDGGREKKIKKSNRTGVEKSNARETHTRTHTQLVVALKQLSAVLSRY